MKGATAVSSATVLVVRLRNQLNLRLVDIQLLVSGYIIKVTIIIVLNLKYVTLIAILLMIIATKSLEQKECVTPTHHLDRMTLEFRTERVCNSHPPSG